MELTKQSDEEKEMYDWLNKDHCPKCGVVELSKGYPFKHCEKCMK